MKWVVYILLFFTWVIVFCQIYNFHDPRGQLLLVVSGLIYTIIWLVLLLLASILRMKDRRAFIALPFLVVAFALVDKQEFFFWGGLAIASAISSLIPSAKK